MEEIPIENEAELSMINTPVSTCEWLARNLYYSSTCDKKGKPHKTCLYPHYKKEDPDNPGYHISEVSVQRLCHAGWTEAIHWAEVNKQEGSTFKGFMVAAASAAKEQGFRLDPAALPDNPYHAHICVEELRLLYDQELIAVNTVLESGIRRRLDNLRDNFTRILLPIPAPANPPSPIPSHCHTCLLR